MTLRLALIAGLTSLILGGQAMADAFPTRAEAMDYIATALPKATSENPKYLTKADGTVSVWLTESVLFPADPTGALAVVMRERFTQTQAGKTTEGRHEAAFSLAAVTVGEFTAPWDVTPTGEAALGLLFTCLAPGCVSARWGDAPSRADKADIYVQDEGARARLLAAFRRLQAP
jgi:hypothetical protein